jgi:hypothetical protein
LIVSYFIFGVLMLMNVILFKQLRKIHYLLKYTRFFNLASNIKSGNVFPEVFDFCNVAYSLDVSHFVFSDGNWKMTHVRRTWIFSC